ncbi:hypothetical protein [Kitasatospora sp. NPDC059827]|uniref:hypothetical protein n=1 Tax=Kitasatospora sp. NPDC059827 TaxID=3346964 RepID=UPI00364A2A8D
MSGAREATKRRARRLAEMRKNGSVTAACAALQQIWSFQRSPAELEVMRSRGIVLRAQFLLPIRGRQQLPPLTQLIRSRGLALRFYLLAIFDAHCRLAVDEPWASARPLTGRGSWCDLVAIDGAYSIPAEQYMRHDTKQERTLADQRQRQVQAALRTLEEFGPEDERVPGPGGPQALVEVPRVGKTRKYGKFSLLPENGRGQLQTPRTYRVPRRTFDGRTVRIPADFFLEGWVQVLTDAEIAVWLILLWHSQRYPKRHLEEGVYLYANRRKQLGLRRDSWEDACARLREFGLIRYAVPPEPEGDKQGATDEPAVPDEAAVLAMLVEQFDGVFASPFDQPDEVTQYEPHRYQVLGGGLRQEALDKVIKETTHRLKGLG